jgi:hypothetical protein
MSVGFDNISRMVIAAHPELLKAPEKPKAKAVDEKVGHVRKKHFSKVHHHHSHSVRHSHKVRKHH